jgi:hypothetical protein
MLVFGYARYVRVLAENGQDPRRGFHLFAP